jgi:ATP-dependent DNA helicase RecG
VIVKVEESPIKPVWAFGRPIKRVGRTNQRLSPGETKRLMDATWGTTWDALTCPMLGLEHIDRRAIEAFLHRAGLSVGTTPESVLQNLRLVTSDGLSNAAALLFAEYPQRFLVGSEVKCARFLGLTSANFLDEQTLEGHLIVTVQVGRSLAPPARIPGV